MSELLSSAYVSTLEIPELRAAALISHIAVLNYFIEGIRRFSSLFTLKCFFLDFEIHSQCSCSHVSCSLCSDGLRPDELEDTFLLLVRITQNYHFSNEIETVLKGNL